MDIRAGSDIKADSNTQGRVPKVILLMAAFALAPHCLAGNIYNSGTLLFSTTNQNMWGTGSGIVPQSESFSFDLNSAVSAGGIAGSIIETTGFTVETHPTVIHGCHGDFCLPDTDLHLPGVPIVETHEITIFIDERTGLEASLRTEGQVNLTSTLGIGGGTVDADVEYSANLVVPHAVSSGTFFNLNPSSDVSQSSITTKSPNVQGEITTSLSAKITGQSRQCFFLAGCNDDSETLLDIGVSETKVLQINTDDLPPDSATVFELDHSYGDLAVFDATAIDLNVDVSPVPPFLTIRGIPGLPRPPVAVNVMQLSLDAPGRVTVAGDSAAGIVSNNAFDDVIRLELDLDTLAAKPTGLVTNVGAFTFTGDLIDIDLAPTIDLNQDFTFTSELMVNLDFDREVLTRETRKTGTAVFCPGGLTQLADGCYAEVTTGFQVIPCSGIACTPRLEPIIELQRVADLIEQDIFETFEVLTTSIYAPWNNLPDIALLDEEEVNIRPTFSLSTEFSNETWFDYDLNFAIDMLKGSASVLGLNLLDGCVLCQNFPVADLGNFGRFDETFGLGGFSSLQGNSFSLQAGVVPEPGTLGLFLVGLMGLSRIKQRHSMG